MISSDDTRPSARDHLALALDVTTLDEARSLALVTRKHVGVVKVGLELFARFGPESVAVAREAGARIFLDLKLHDIPETVERAVEAIGKLGVDMITVHTSGGRKMLEGAVRAAAKAPRPLLVLGVTVLTSLGPDDLRAAGVARSPAEQVAGLASLAWEAGVRGFVTSAEEVGALRSLLPESFLVTPGIRPAGADAQDQKRTSTPAAAIARGASLLVVGRPIRDASDRPAAASAIADEIAQALSLRESVRA